MCSARNTTILAELYSSYDHLQHRDVVNICLLVQSHNCDVNIFHIFLVFRTVWAHWPKSPLRYNRLDSHFLLLVSNLIIFTFDVSTWCMILLYLLYYYRKSSPWCDCFSWSTGWKKRRKNSMQFRKASVRRLNALSFKGTMTSRQRLSPTSSRSWTTNSRYVACNCSRIRHS